MVQDQTDGGRGEAETDRVKLTEVILKDKRLALGQGVGGR